MFKKVLWCVGFALVAAMYALLAWADAWTGEPLTILVAAIALIVAGASKWALFKKTEELSYGFSQLACGGWCLLLFLLFVIRYVMILIDSSRLLIKGLAE